MLPTELLLFLLSSVPFVSATAVARPRVAELPVITTGPNPMLARELARRQDDSSRTYATVTQDPSFVGWYIGQSTQAQYCGAGQTWTSSGNYAKCCSTGQQCAQTIACSANSYMIDDSGSKAVCPTGYECASVTVYSEFPSQNPVYNLLCVDNQWSAWTMYRDIPATHTYSTTSSSSSSASTSASNSASASANPSHSSSKAWIAGAVAGPIVGLALLLGLGFYLWRRRQSAGHAAPGSSNFVMHENQTDYKPYGPGTPGFQDPSYSAEGSDWRKSTMAPPYEAAPLSEADSRPIESHPIELPATVHSVL